MRSCYDERWATLHKQAYKLLAAPPPPPGGGLLLTSCCAFAACTCFQVTPCILRSLSACLLDLERFSYERGRSRSLLPCPAMSTLTSCLACTVRLQHACVRPCMCTADRACHPIITTICTALPTCHLRCMSNKLIFLILP
jgi:hypothetical protein